jgi:hypothetical protein
LIELGEEDARDLAKDIGMGRGHTVRLVRWIKEQSTPQEGATTTHTRFKKGEYEECNFSVLLPQQYICHIWSFKNMYNVQ